MASQSLTQSQKAIASMDRGEQERIVNDTVKFLLVLDQKKMPIKKADINKHVLKEHSKAFPVIIAEAAKRLSKVFGIEVKELEEKQKGSYILLNKLEISSDDNHLIWGEEDDSKRGLLMVVLSLIFMSGNVITDNQLWSGLKKFGIEPDVPHEVFNDVKKLIMQEWVRQCYLEITRMPNTDPPLSEIKWGQRAQQEITKRNVLSFVSKIYNIEELSQWTSQWQDVLSSEGQDENQPANS
ncbi:non-structural maintenance of chromosomes element 3 homolog [Mercenaria mercenaria]|uniref:non-structural maintenance of chromosomes element 3 homolog n=1 Tax=Mercenaria mercenaria TaxID=6596 RepID=UPI00234F5BA7|nr:non-structural maintenance of chromosomes element 3 homolog [Mercenaria mercenaria]XP_053375569.1 non-structural maintenance of chromosomes element 3 homolog [Mercenaria mercenaria]XP_053375570.1 non-structural maintenance of chromosomes element 3 homolog [Mercenaria mercenaria]